MECNNNHVIERGPERVAVPTHQIMADIPLSTGHGPQHAHSTPQWPHGTRIFKLPLHCSYYRISPSSHRGFQFQPIIRGDYQQLYDLPSLARKVQYLHAAAGFPTKETGLNSIRNGNYLIWPLLTIHNVNRHFP